MSKKPKKIKNQYNIKDNIEQKDNLLEILKSVPESPYELNEKTKRILDRNIKNSSGMKRFNNVEDVFKDLGI
ncbi:MAG: hypothetical protein LBR11_05680 [Deltaproteobacteria bacterium]|jgi:hypothetical protein|nr:hypothetical protein [Deltaproteobacteria bacterium]